MSKQERLSGVITSLNLHISTICTFAVFDVAEICRDFELHMLEISKFIHETEDISMSERAQLSEINKLCKIIQLMMTEIIYLKSAVEQDTECHNLSNQLLGE
ncbi:hypothetical protein G9P44_002675 [Scheffersomyces stipitis]|nr:hypothetical protein G9P44_002675 [Scheffersomyces stipitis]